MTDRWTRSIRQFVTSAPPWVRYTAIGLLAALPLLVWGAYVTAGSIGGPSYEPPDEARADEVYEDTDNDGLPTLLENYVYGTDPNETKTASSVVPDGYLAEHGYDPSNPNAEDAWAAYPSPGETPEAWGTGPLPPEQRVTVREVYLWDQPDGYDENESGPWDNALSPRVWETPSGLPMPWLLTHDLDPTNPEVGERVLDPAPEGDGLTVAESYETATDPRATDTDDDGLDDDVEIEETGTDPSAFATAGNGLADGWAVANDLDPTDPSAAHADPDRDGLTNAEEYNASVDAVGRDRALNGSGLDPRRWSTAGTALPDGWVVDQDLDPLDTGLPDEQLGCASDYGPLENGGAGAGAGTGANAGGDGSGDGGDGGAEDLGDVCLTVLDAYTYDRPDDWEGTVQGPWRGGLSASTNDTDDDGLPDPVEIRGWLVNRTTGQGQSAEAEEVAVTADPLTRDTDNDGLVDFEEFRGRLTDRDRSVTFPTTDPGNSDTDFDGLSDGREILEASRILSERFGEPLVLDPVNRDTDDDGLPDGTEWSVLTTRAKACRAGDGGYGFTNPVQDPRAILAQVAATHGRSLDPSSPDVCELAEPWGDPDDDGTPNILDDDADEDRLLDGWEVTPALYDQSPFASEHPRSRTDPLNPDTDGDELPDAWEVEFGAWDRGLGSFNLDPAQWSTFGDDTSDAERDLDDDSITWYTFHRAADGLDRAEHTFEATNLVEYRNETDPNEPSTGGHGLLDGWTIFWGVVYPDLELSEVGDVYPGAPGPMFIPPGAPSPSPLRGEDEVVDTARTSRFAESTNNGPGERLVAVYQDVQTADGDTLTLYHHQRRVEYSFLDTQANRTNPYVDDTDGDGAPDAWEAGYATMHGGQPSPVRHEGGTDADRDGLSLEKEAGLGTDPLVADTDRGGVPDGEESQAQRNPLSPQDDASVRNPDADLDCDGVPDVDETTGWNHPSEGTIETNPSRSDSDGDGLLDGFDRTLDPSSEADAECVETLRQAHVLELPAEEGGVQFLGEASWRGDPGTASTVGDGVPDGWRAFWGLDADETQPFHETAYDFGRPAWWTEGSMGPWLWGLSPDPGADVDDDGTADTRLDGDTLVVLDPDLDNDGLSDALGEDPTPGARPAPVPPDGWPNASGISRDDARERAASFGVAPDRRDQLAEHDADEDGVPDAYDQAPARVADLALADADPSADRVEVDVQAARDLVGRVEALDADGTPHPVENATIVAYFRDAGKPVGAAFSAPDGSFEVNVSLGQQHEVDVPDGVTLMGQRGGTVSWTANLTDVELGPGPEAAPNELFVRVYNTSGAAEPGAPTHLGLPTEVTLPDGSTTTTTAEGIQGTRSETIPLLITAAAELDVQAPAAAPPGETVTVDLTLTDTTGQPIPNATVTLDALGETRTRETDDTGGASLDVAIPDEGGATVALAADFGGRNHVQPASASHAIQVKHPTSLGLDSLDPLPPRAGDPLEVRGRLTTAADAATPSGDDPLPVTLSTDFAETTLNLTQPGPFNATLDVPPGRTGDAELRLEFPGSPALLPSSANATLTVRDRVHLNLDAGKDTVRPGESVRLVARLLDPDGTPVPEAPLALEGFPDRDPAHLTTDATGEARFTWNATARPGTYAISAAFDGSDRRAPQRNQSWVTVAEEAALTLDPPAQLVRGSLTTLGGRLTDGTGTGIPGQPLDLRVGQAPPRTALADDDGRFSFTWATDTDRELGPVDLAVDFDGSLDGRYEAVQRSATANVTQGLELEPLVAALDRGPARHAVHARLDDGRDLPPGTLTLSVPELGVTQTSEVQRGRAEYEFTIPESTSLGRTTALYTYTPEGPVPPRTVRGAIDVVSPVDVRLDTPTRVVRGGSLAVEGTVLDDHGQPVSSGQVDVRLLDHRENLTLDEGRFATGIPVPEDTPIGDTDLEILFTSEDPYRDGGTNQTIHVQRPASLSLELEGEGQAADTVQASLLLTGPEGEGLGHERVLLTGSDGTRYLVETDGSGRAHLLLDNDEATRYNATYPGGDTYTPASTAVEVGPGQVAYGGGTPWGLVAAGLASLLLLAVLGVYVHRQRQAAVAEAVEALEEGREELIAGNEYRGVILKTYRDLVSIVAERDVVPDDQETLREFATKLEHALGLPGPALDRLFTVFERTFYGPREIVGPDERTTAVRALGDVLGELDLDPDDASQEGETT